MGTMIVLILCILIVPLTMLVFGILMLRRPPKEINGGFGYRTRMSTKSEETWKFAHEKCGRIWTWTGAVLLLVSVVAVVLLLRSGGADVLMKWTTTLSMGQVVVLLATILPVERALKKQFDENGKPKE